MGEGWLKSLDTAQSATGPRVIFYFRKKSVFFPEANKSEVFAFRVPGFHKIQNGKRSSWSISVGRGYGRGG
jgi:hypothetical protein